MIRFAVADIRNENWKEKFYCGFIAHSYERTVLGIEVEKGNFLTEQDSKSRVNGKCNRNQQSYLPVVRKAGY